MTKGWGVAKVLKLETREATMAMTGLTGNSPAVWHFVSGLLLGLAEAARGLGLSVVGAG